MSFSLLGTKQVECRRCGETNENYAQYGDDCYPLAVDDLHDGVVGRVDK